MSAPLLEHAVLDDAPALAGIFLRCWQRAYRGIVADEIIDALDPVEVTHWWRALITTSGCRVLLARDSGRAVGMVRFGADEADGARGHIFSLYVDPNSSGAGVGRTLLGRARQELAQAGYRDATLWVFAANERALRFYEAAGWTPTGETRVSPKWQSLELLLAAELG